MIKNTEATSSSTMTITNKKTTNFESNKVSKSSHPISLFSTTKLTLLVTIIFSSFISLTTQKELKFVFEMFRHGARSPFNLDSTSHDIFNKKWFAAGELTGVGMRQHFLLGFRNSEVYGRKMNITKYTTTEIFITSTNYNRTILSAYSQLQGFFPPSSGPILSAEQMLHASPPIEYNFEPELAFLANNALRAQSNVFGIKVLNKLDHEFYLHESKVCQGVKPKIDAARESVKIKEFIEFFNKNYAPKVYKVINKTEQSFNLSKFENLQNLFDAFICGYTDGRNYTADFAEQNLSLNEFRLVTREFLNLEIYNYLISDEYIALMSMSPLFTKLLNYMEQRIQIDVNNITSYSTKDPKISMLSGHDTNLAAFLLFLRTVFQNRSELIYPEFASSVYIELVYNGDVVTEIPKERYFVNVIFNEENIFNEAISYTYFSEQIRKRIIKDVEINQFCGFKKDEKSQASDALKFMVIIFSVIAFGLFAWYMVILFKEEND